MLFRRRTRTLTIVVANRNYITPK